LNKIKQIFLKTSSKVEYNLVKEYSRPAAGKIVKSKELRTIETLLKTVEYLVQQ
jgi:hypothetical protein